MGFSNDEISETLHSIRHFNYKYSRYYKMLDAKFKFERSSKITKFKKLQFKDKVVKVNYVGKYTTGYKFSTDFFKKSESIKNCMNYSVWDFYRENNILDLKQIYRCKDNRFCPNCKKVDVSKFIHKVKEILPDMLTKYDAYLMTLTIPNVDSCELSDSLTYLAACFRKLNYFFSKKNKKLHLINFIGGFKVLEVTYNKILNNYHPHYHCLVLIEKGIDKKLFVKKYKDRFSRKRNKYNYLSDFELLLKQVWSLIYNNIRLSQNNLDFYTFSPGEDFILNTQLKWLEVDFQPLDDKGIYEIFKYTFKDTDIINFNVFKDLYFSLSRKRLRQGFGILYNFKCEDLEQVEVDIIDNYLSKKEEPQEIYIKSLKALVGEFNQVNKISRYNSDMFSL